MSNGNVLKYNWVVMKDDEKRVIDTKDFINKGKTNPLKSHSRTDRNLDGFDVGLEIQEVDILFGGDEVANDLVIQPTILESEREILLSEVQAEINKMKADAREYAEAFKHQGYEEGKTLGYQEGFQTATLTLEEEYKKKELELEQLREQLENSYQQKISELEPFMVEVITDVYERVFHLELVDLRKALTYLISDILHNVDGNRAFIVHLSKKDHPYVSMNKNIVLSGLSNNITVEFVEDNTVSQGECFIETNNGIFDCGIETQLIELTKQIKLLSYEK